MTEPQFDTPFFNDHGERRVIEIADHRGQPRAYTFPTMFAHTRATMMVFTADVERSRELLAASGADSVWPVRVAFGRCMFAIAAFRYGAISDGMQGYHEMAFGIPVDTGRIALLPALARRFWASFGLYVLDLPVDSEENCRRGTEIWGLPKTMKQFAIADSPTVREVTLRGSDGLCFRARVPRGGRRTAASEINRVYSRKAGQLLLTKSFVDGACWQYFTTSELAARVELEFGATKPYSDFAQLEIDPRPLMVREFDCLSTVLYGPDPVA